MSTHNHEPQQVLYSRRTAARVLGDVSVATVIRLERLGRLKPIKLSGTPTGTTYYRTDEVHALVSGANAEKPFNGGGVQRYRPQQQKTE